MRLLVPWSSEAGHGHENASGMETKNVKTGPRPTPGIRTKDVIQAPVDTLGRSRAQLPPPFSLQEEGAGVRVLRVGCEGPVMLSGEQWSPALWRAASSRGAWCRASLGAAHTSPEGEVDALARRVRVLRVGCEGPVMLSGEQWSPALWRAASSRGAWCRASLGAAHTSPEGEVDALARRVRALGVERRG